MNFTEQTPGGGDGGSQTRPAAAMAAAPPPVYIMVQPTTTPDKEHFEKTFPKKVVAAVAAAQIFVFVVAIISEIVLIVNVRYGPPISIGSGIWCGVFLAICGILGLLASWKPSQCIIIAYMVLSIISAVLATTPIVTGGIGAAHAKSYYYYDSDDRSRRSRERLMAAIYGVLCFCGLVQLTLGIASSVMCCRAVCCRSGKTTGAVVYNPGQIAGGGVAEGAGIDMSSVAPVQAALLGQRGGDAVTVPMGGSVALSSHPPKYEDAAASSSKALDLEDGRSASVEGEKYQRFQ